MSKNWLQQNPSANGLQAIEASRGLLCGTVEPNLGLNSPNFVVWHHLVAKKRQSTILE